MLLIALVSCSRPNANNSGTGNSNEGASSSAPSIQGIRQAMEANQWAEAERLSQAWLVEHPNDVTALQLGAKIAFAQQNPLLAGDRMVEATNADGFDDVDVLNRAVAALLMTGRLYDSIELLQKAVAKYPDRHSIRRILFDFLMSVEERHSALPHGRVLVRQRQFDSVLLYSLSAIERRDMEDDSMAELARRNPNDARLRIAEARRQFDRGEWEGLETILDNILKQSPRNVPAQNLLGQYLVATDQFDRLSEWQSRSTANAKETWQHWSVFGDWASHQGRHREAARAYWESMKRDFDVGDVLAKLARTLLILQSKDDSVDDKTIHVIQHRAERLARFFQDKDRFYKSTYTSNDAAADVAESLVQLGRYWEAEAWAAVAMTKPDENVEKVQSVRQRTIQLLSKTTPWQAKKGQPIIGVDLSHYPIPTGLLTQTPNKTGVKEAISSLVVPILNDQAEARGLSRYVSSSSTDNRIPIFGQMESGGCAVDYDLDGWPDIYVATAGGDPTKQNSGDNFLYRNHQGQFVDVTSFAETNDNGFAQGVTFGDINEDGFDDVVVMNYGTNRLFMNNGDGTFSDRTDWLPVHGPSWNTSAAIADLNGDGLSDMVCLTYCRGLAPLTTKCADANQEPLPCLPTELHAGRDEFYEGMPTGGFRLATDRWAADPEHKGRGLGIVIGSLDANRGLDVFVANDMTSNHFWSATNVRDRFALVESATIRGLAVDGRFQPQACMGIAVGDLDEDGDTDFFVTNFQDEHNTFYEQSSPGIWADRTLQRGLMKTCYALLGFGSQAVDLDNDSHTEIAITNGHVYNQPKQPADYTQPFQIVRRVDGSKFESCDLSANKGYVRQKHVGRAMWTMDANRDGRMDLAITHQGEPIALLMNQTPVTNDWLTLRLVGTKSSRDAIGASVSIQVGNRRRYSPLVSGNGFHCANQRVLHFGLGKINSSSQVIATVTWPSGDESVHHISVNSDNIIIQDQ